MNIEVRLGLQVCHAANVLEVFPTVQAFFNFQIAERIVVIGLTVGLCAAIGVKHLQRRLLGIQRDINVAQSEMVTRRVVRMMASAVSVYCMCWRSTWIFSSICAINGTKSAEILMRGLCNSSWPIGTVLLHHLSIR